MRRQRWDHRRLRDLQIAFLVSGVEPNQFGLFVDGTPAAGTVYGSGAGAQQNTGQAILVLGAGDVLTVMNHSSAARHAPDACRWNPDKRERLGRDREVDLGRPWMTAV